MKYPFRGALRKTCSGNMRQIYRRPPTKNRDFKKVAKQLYRNCTSVWVFSCTFVTDVEIIPVDWAIIPRLINCFWKSGKSLNFNVVKCAG